jgi:hypothetical protein
MRKALAKNVGERKKFTGTFVKYGKKKNYHGYSEETILIKDIIDLEQGRLVAHHLWFANTKNFQQLPLAAGAQIEFEARIKKYEKGYRNVRYQMDNRTTDYKLSHPTKISLISR